LPCILDQITCLILIKQFLSIDNGTIVFVLALLQADNIQAQQTTRGLFSGTLRSSSSSLPASSTPQSTTSQRSKTPSPPGLTANNSQRSLTSNLNNTMARTTKSISISARTHEELKNKAAQAAQLAKDLGVEKKKSAKHEKVIATLQKQLEDAANGVGNFSEVIAAKDKTIKQLSDLVVELQGTLRKNGNVHPSELNRELSEQTFHAAKIYLSRTVRWFGDHEDAEKHTRSLIQYLPKGKESLGGLSEEEYGFKYRQTANKGLQACKQNVQSEGKKAARCK